MPADFPGFIYAGAVAAGGILGYYKAGIGTVDFLV